MFMFKYAIFAHPPVDTQMGGPAGQLGLAGKSVGLENASSSARQHHNDREGNAYRLMEVPDFSHDAHVDGLSDVAVAGSVTTLPSGS
jgi:hypothetical protein